MTKYIRECPSTKAYKVKNMQEKTWYTLNAMVFAIFAAAVILSSSNAYAYVAPINNCQQVVTGTYGFFTFMWGSFGTGYNPICDILERLNSWMRGTTGKALATLAVAILGMAALFGKVSWTTALLVVIGVGIVFGAGTVMGYIGPQLETNVDVNPITQIMDNFAFVMTDEAGRAIAIIATLVVGIGALFGKVTWVQAISLAAGIGIAFGAGTIIQGVWARDPLDATALFLTEVSDPLGAPFMLLVNFMTGSIGMSIATAILLCLGFAAMFGKVSWSRAVILCVGVALMFGAADVVYILSGPMTLCQLLPATSDSFDYVICKFMEELQGPMGKTLSMLAVILAGILAMLGKISWEFGFILMVGIAIIFGADTIVELFEPSVTGATCSSPAPSAPSTGNAIADVLCYIVMILYGPAGKALATIAVIMVGFGALLGKASFGQAAIVAAGIAVCFGAPTIVTLVMPTAVMTGCTLTGTDSFGNFGTGLPGQC